MAPQFAVPAEELVLRVREVAAAIPPFPAELGLGLPAESEEGDLVVGVTLLALGLLPAEVVLVARRPLALGGDPLATALHLELDGRHHGLDDLVGFESRLALPGLLVARREEDHHDVCLERSDQHE